MRFADLPVFATALAVAGPAAADASSWTGRLPADALVQDFDAVTSAVVDGGRVWWVRLSAAGATVQSRSLAGGAIRSVPLQLTSLVPPGEASAANGRPLDLLTDVAARIRDGHVAITGLWTTRPTGDLHEPPAGFASTATLAAFDAASGRLVRQASYPAQGGRPGSGLLSGAPASFGEWPTAPTAGYRLSNPVTGAVNAGAGWAVAGDYVLAFGIGDALQAAGAWKGSNVDRGSVVVSNAATGAISYRLRTSTVVRSARAAGGSPVLTTLGMSDGSLKVLLRRRSGHGLVAVFVGPKGQVRRLTRSLPDATEVSTVRFGTRVFVQVRGSKRVRGRHRTCGGLWLVDASGRRGRRLSVGTTSTARQGLPSYTDKRFAVWTNTFDGPSGIRTAVRVEDSLQRLSLRRSEIPTCRL